MANPRVGLALGGGAARGLAHLGVLEVLVREEVPIDLVVGTSAGALVGGVFAAGADLGLTQRLAASLDWGHLVQVNVPRLGFVRPDQLLQILRLLTKGRTFAETAIPFCAVAVDIERGEQVILREGPLAEAILASCAVPGIFVPQRVDGRLLVDGGVLNLVPADVARQEGAEVVIAVDVLLEEPVCQVKNIIDVINQSFEIMQREIARYRMMQTADVFIRPDLGTISGYRLDASTSIIDAGRVAAQAALPEIRRILAERAELAVRV